MDEYKQGYKDGFKDASDGDAPEGWIPRADGKGWDFEGETVGDQAFRANVVEDEEGGYGFQILRGENEDSGWLANKEDAFQEAIWAYESHLSGEWGPIPEGDPDY